MIILKEMKWSNLFSYGKDNYLDFTKNKITQVLGKNGSGKSSISLILEEVLFNKNSKGIKKGNILNRYVKDKSYSIEVTFDKITSTGTDTYTVKTVRSSTQKVSLFKNGQDISNHTATATYEALQDILGFSDSSLIYQSSALSMDFLTSTDSKRKAFLVELLKLSKYSELLEVVKKAAKGYDDSYARAEGKLSSIKAWLDKNSKTVLEIKEFLEKPEVDLSTYSEKIGKLTEQVSNIDNTNKIVRNNIKYRDAFFSLTMPVPLSKPTRNTAEILPLIGERKAQVAQIVSMTQKMGSLGDKCPTCLQSIDEAKVEELLLQYESSLATISKELKEFEALKTSIEKEEKAYKEYENALKEYTTAKSNYDPLADFELKDKGDLSTQLDNINAEYTKLKKEIETIDSANKSISENNAKVEMFKEQKSQFETELLQVTNDLVNLGKKKSVIDILKKAFSSNGLIAYKIEVMVKDLEVLTNQYLSEISDGRFVLIFKVESDKLNVVICDNGTDIDISALSNGEKSKVNTATLLAIRKLMNSLSSSKVNLLILDETIENLDVDSKERLIEVLLNEPHLNTFLVSHSYSHPLVSKLVATKEDNISKLEEF